MSVIQGWMKHIRKQIIDHIRPGRDEQELLAVLGRAEAVQSDAQRSMLEQLIEFHDTRVREVMVPRSEIHAVEAQDSLADIEQVMLTHGISRLPVMDGDIDHVLGVVHVQDVVKARLSGEAPALATLLRPCLRVLELEQVSGLLSEMRQHSCRIAIVLDEYGGTAGLISLADLLVEIIGEIGEDGEDEESELETLADGSYMVLARMHIEELAEALGIQLPQGDYDTVGGWLTAHLGRIPKVGEQLKVRGLQIQIIEADPRRISKLRIQQLTKSSAKELNTKSTDSYRFKADQVITTARQSDLDTKA
ncbi:HlyC/CorC family transporter [Mariprofundus sp. EBB-1]|uniref:hemolysin family protein n=1 Tax=Mariprofundus sp. EBB-1 TaxID=2650971 RepID=UPI000EF285B8|nr:hemolysin family protein [Mariprofundus sp. EBB-1]RLL54790.1 HlyC/CorC family transporter [Mariprofundus sp. EBB-1]